MSFVIPSLFLLFNCACSAPIKPNIFYSIPTVTYLRDCPDYDCQVVGEVFNGDQILVLQKNDAGWWQVQSKRDQKIGWTQRDLFSKTPLSIENYFIKEEGTPLRDAPSQEVVSRTLLAQGDRVQKLATRNGWWRVLVEKDRALGWIPAAAASENRPEPSGPEKAKTAAPEKAGQASSSAKTAPEPDHYYVAAETLSLHLIPFSDAKVVKELRINDKVRKISQSGSQWFKVRYLETGAEGWALARFFRDTPVTNKTQIVTKGERPEKKPPGKKPPTPDPFESETLEPEGM